MDPALGSSYGQTLCAVGVDWLVRRGLHLCCRHDGEAGYKSSGSDEPVATRDPRGTKNRLKGSLFELNIASIIQAGRIAPLFRDVPYADFSVKLQTDHIASRCLEDKKDRPKAVFSSLRSLRRESNEAQCALLAVSHEAQAAEADNHHEPCGRLGDSADCEFDDEVVVIAVARGTSAAIVKSEDTAIRQSGT